MPVITLVFSSEISALPTSFFRYHPKKLVGRANIDVGLIADHYKFIVTPSYTVQMVTGVGFRITIRGHVYLLYLALTIVFNRDGQS